MSKFSRSYTIDQLRAIYGSPKRRKSWMKELQLEFGDMPDPCPVCRRRRLKQRAATKRYRQKQKEKKRVR